MALVDGKNSNNEKSNFAREVDDKLLCVEKDKDKDWVIDSGACFHICKQKETFIDYKEQKDNEESANGHDVKVEDAISQLMKDSQRNGKQIADQAAAS